MPSRAVGSCNHNPGRARGVDTCFPVGSRLPPRQWPVHNGRDHEARQDAADRKQRPKSSAVAHNDRFTRPRRGIWRPGSPKELSGPVRACDSNGRASGPGPNSVDRRGAISIAHGGDGDGDADPTGPRADPGARIGPATPHGIPGRRMARRTPARPGYPRPHSGRQPKRWSDVRGPTRRRLRLRPSSPSERIACPS